MIKTTLKINQGVLRGIEKKTEEGNVYLCFKGIPYAKPPLGNLRFKAPQPPNSWSGVLDASEHRNIAYQHTKFLPEIPKNQSEDCLYLNVYVPKKENNKELIPVMVWIHGGAYLTGSGNSDLFGPDYLIQEDVIVVTFNYRLGIFGFLKVDDPKAEIPGNAGMKDMVMALNWVKENIAFFGGNPNNVTVFGQSAGAVSVHLLTLSPLSKGLFHRGIITSGVALAMWALIHPLRKPLKEIADVLNLPCESEIEVVNKLYELTSEELAKIQLKLNFIHGIPTVLGPTVEIESTKSAFLTEDPLSVIRTGKVSNIPLMVGYTSREGLFFMRNGEKFLTGDIEDFVPFDLNVSKGSQQSKEIAEKIRNFYYDNEKPTKENYDITFTLLGDSFFGYPAYKMVMEHVASTSNDIYFYRFSVDAKFNVMKKILDINLPGAVHSDTNWYMFKRFNTPPKLIPNSVEDLTIKRFIKLFTNFAKYGNPNPQRKSLLIPVTWKPSSKTEITYLEFGENLTIGVDPDYNRLKFWEELYNSLKE